LLPGADQIGYVDVDDEQRWVSDAEASGAPPGPEPWHRQRLTLSQLAGFLITSVGVTLLVEVFGVDERIAPVIAAVAAIPVSFLLTRRILTGRAIGSRTLRHRRRVERPN